MTTQNKKELIDIVKRGGRRPTERFNQKKLHGSIYAACTSVRTPEGEADSVATTVCTIVVEWCEKKPIVTSADIRRVAADNLSTYNPEAAYMYKHHRLVI